MAIYSPRLWWVAIALLLWAPHTHCREISHEDIRDAMMSLVYMVRSSEEKLERHEVREKALGDTLKKLLNNLDKKHRALEPLKGMISRLDDRLSNVETILLQKEDREKSSQNKINEALANIQTTLAALTAPKAPAELDNSLTGNDDLLRRLDATDAKIDAVNKEIKSLKSSFNADSLRAICLEVSSDMNPFEKHISDAEKLLNKYELKLSEYNVTGSNSALQTDFVPLNEVAAADEAWHNKMSEVMERQEKDIKKIQHLLSDAESMWKDLPRLADLNRVTNQTLDAVAVAKEDILTNDKTGVSKVVSKIREMSDRLAATNEDIQTSLTQSNTMTEHVSLSIGAMHGEIQQMKNNNELIQTTADNVLATKKRLEHIVSQIIVQLVEIIKDQHQFTNRTVDLRLETLEAVITSNQTKALAKVGATFESEMKNVWRQISIMHSQIMSSKDTLINLSANTEQYVNNSTATMTKVKTEVGDITTQIVTLKNDVNYLLGQLSVTTQEFKNMATELKKTLDRMNKDHTTSTAAPMKDAGPGPHPIPGAEPTP